MFRNSAAMAVTMVLIFAASAATPGGAIAQNIRTDVKTDIVIAPDRSVTQTIHQEVTPLVESAVREAAQGRWVIPGNQTLEVVEAYTRKADGRVVPTDPSEFVTQDGVVDAVQRPPCHWKKV